MFSHSIGLPRPRFELEGSGGVSRFGGNLKIDHLVMTITSAEAMVCSMLPCGPRSLGLL
jgi:hypothetical protein